MQGESRTFDYGGTYAMSANGQTVSDKKDSIFIDIFGGLGQTFYTCFDALKLTASESLPEDRTTSWAHKLMDSCVRELSVPFSRFSRPDDGSHTTFQLMLCFQRSLIRLFAGHHAFSSSAPCSYLQHGLCVLSLSSRAMLLLGGGEIAAVQQSLKWLL